MEVPWAPLTARVVQRMTDPKLVPTVEVAPPAPAPQAPAPPPLEAEAEAEVIMAEPALSLRPVLGLTA